GGGQDSIALQSLRSTAGDRHPRRRIDGRAGPNHHGRPPDGRIPDLRAGPPRARVRLLRRRHKATLGV
ncbi:MAG: hypothetical protein AVDCRST_MAG78-908, partial [uncultured Rubrobacteraceae bacterium]